MSTTWLESHGIRIEARSKTWVRVAVPLSRVRITGEDPEVAKVELPLRPVPLDCAYGMGSVVSQGVALTYADSFQAHNFTGAGIKIAIVDGGFIDLDSAIVHGELPASTIDIELPGNDGNPITTVTNHGTCVAEQAMGMAPGATLYCIQVADQVDMENTRDTLKARGIRVANLSVGWFGGGYYNDSGQIDRIVDSSHDIDSVFWAVAAGNQAQAHWRGPWLNSSGGATLFFSSVDSFLTVTDSVDSETVSLNFNWNQYSSTQGPATDLYLYLYNKNGTLVDSSTDVASPTEGEPMQELSFVYCTAQGPYSVKVVKHSGPTTNLNMTLFALADYATLTYPSTKAYAGPGSSLCEPGDCHGAFTAGAVNQAYYDSASPPIEFYSSRGPTTDGREKPDIAATNMTSCYINGGTAVASGTSFSSPTVAGAAALLLQRYAPLSIVKIADTLRAWAKHAPSGGWDSAYGAGLLNLKYPSAPPVLSSPTNNTTGIPVSGGCSLTWGTLPGAASYTLQVSTSTSFSTTVVDLSSLTVSQSALSVTLAGGTTYYWRVQGVFTACCTGPWSSAWSFTTTGVHLTVPLLSGWNLSSLNIHPTDSTTKGIFSGFRGFLLVKDGSGDLYCPSLGIDQIDTFRTGRGYQIYTDSADDTLRLSGSPVAVASTPISLQASVWSIIAYLPQTNMPIATALAGISGQIILAKDNEGNVYWLDTGINSIDTMRVGQGYWIVTSAAATLTYPAGAAKLLSGEKMFLNPGTPRHYPKHPVTGNNASFYADRIELAGRAASDNCEVGAFDTKGALVGAGIVTGGRTAFAIWGNDRLISAGGGCSPPKESASGYGMVQGNIHWKATGGDAAPMVPIRSSWQRLSVPGRRCLQHSTSRVTPTRSGSVTISFDARQLPVWPGRRLPFLSTTLMAASSTNWQRVTTSRAAIP